MIEYIAANHDASDGERRLGSPDREIRSIWRVFNDDAHPVRRLAPDRRW